MSTFAPLQFLRSAQNPLVWTAVDNGTDTRTSLIIYYGAVNTLPSDTGMYEVNCIMMHQAEKQLYANTGTTTTPNWEAFGPGSAFPQPLVPGTFLFTDGATVYWATSLVGQVQYNASNLNTYGILNFNNLLVASNDVPNSRINVDLDVVSLASNTTFINSLLANTTFISGISTALLALSSFITNLITTLLANTTFISGITNIVNTSTSTSINLGTQITGTLGLGNGGTGASLSDPNHDAVWVWDDTANSTRLASLSGLSYDSGTNTLSASGTGGIVSINGDTTTAQVIAAGTGISVSSSGGTTTITNTSAGSANNKVYLDSSSKSQSTGTLYTAPIPGGTLGTNNAIRFTLVASSVTIQSGSSITISVAYGSGAAATFTMAPFTGSVTSQAAIFTGYVIADGSANSQKVSVTGTWPAVNSAGAQVDNGTSATTEDSALPQNLVISMTSSTGGGTPTLATEALIVEAIS